MLPEAGTQQGVLYMTGPCVACVVQSWLCGAWVRHFEPSMVELHSSRGHETARSKLLMRLTVFFADVACELVLMSLACSPVRML